MPAGLGEREARAHMANVVLASAPCHTVTTTYVCRPCAQALREGQALEFAESFEDWGTQHWTDLAALERRAALVTGQQWRGALLPAKRPRA